MDDGLIGGSISADGGNVDEHGGGRCYYSGSTFIFKPPGSCPNINNFSLTPSLAAIESAADQVNSSTSIYHPSLNQTCHSRRI